MSNNARGTWTMVIIFCAVIIVLIALFTSSHAFHHDTIIENHRSKVERVANLRQERKEDAEDAKKQRQDIKKLDNSDLQYLRAIGNNEAQGINHKYGREIYKPDQHGDYWTFYIDHKCQINHNDFSDNKAALKHHGINVGVNFHQSPAKVKKIIKHDDDDDGLGFAGGMIYGSMLHNDY